MPTCNRPLGASGRSVSPHLRRVDQSSPKNILDHRRSAFDLEISQYSLQSGCRLRDQIFIPHQTSPVTPRFPTAKQLLRLPAQPVDVLLFVVNLITIKPDRTALGVKGPYGAQHVTKVANDDNFASIGIELPDDAWYFVRYMLFREV